MARAPRGKKPTSVKVNFKDIETRTRVSAEGDYPLKVLEVTPKTFGTGNEGLEFIFEVTDGKSKGAKAWFTCTFDEKSLWKLHALLTAMGVEVEDDEMDIDLTELVDREVMGVFTPDTYNGKRSFKMTDFASIDDYKAPAEEGGKKSKKDKKAKDEPVEETKDEGKKSKKDKSGKKDKGAKEEKKSKKETYATSDVEDMDEDELKALIKKHKLDVDPKEHKKLAKLVKAVVSELDDADLIED